MENENEEQEYDSNADLGCCSACCGDGPGLWNKADTVVAGDQKESV
jgi:hypothetical protein